MFFKQLATKESSLSYFFGCGGLGKGVVVDVMAGDEDWFIGEARKANVTITHVIDTHVHADRYPGGRSLARAVGAPYFLHESVIANISDAPPAPAEMETILRVKRGLQECGP